MTKTQIATIIAGVWLAVMLIVLTQLDRPALCEVEGNNEGLSLYEMAVWELVRREGLSLEAYVCPAGFKTIGIGSRTDTLDAVTLSEARSMLRDDLQNRYDAIARMLPDHQRHEWLAVALFAHNIGLSRLVTSPQWERIKNRTEDCDSMWKEYSYFKSSSGWVKSPNLERARSFEVALFNCDTEYLHEQREELKANALRTYTSAIDEN